MTTFDDSASYWNEDEAGARWVRMRPQIDRLMEPITAALLEAGNASTGERVIDQSHLDFVLADATTAELPSDSVNLVTSRFGVMFVHELLHIPQGIGVVITNADCVATPAASAGSYKSSPSRAASTTTCSSNSTAERGASMTVRAR